MSAAHVFKKLSRIQQFAVAASVVAIAFASYDYFASERATQLLVKSPVMQAGDAPRVEHIRIRTGSDGIDLQRTGGEWFLEAANGDLAQRFPADVHRVLDFLDRLGQLKVERRASEPKPTEGFEGGTTVTLSAAGGELLTLRLSTTNVSNASGGLWVDLGSRGVMWLAQPFAASSLLKDWELKTILKIASSRVKGVDFAPPPNRKGGKGFSVAREAEAEAFVIREPAGAGKAIDEKILAPLVQGLDGVVFQRRIPRSEGEVRAAQSAGTAKFQLFDGGVITIKVLMSGLSKAGSPPQKYFLDIEGGGGSTQDLAQRWIFEVTSSEAMKFVKGLDDVLPKPDKKKGGGK